MRKRKLTAAILTVLILCLAACSGSTAVQQTAAITETVKQTEAKEDKTKAAAAETVPESMGVTQNVETTEEETEELTAKSVDFARVDGERILHVLLENHRIGQTDKETNISKASVDFPQYSLSRQDLPEYEALQKALQLYNEELASRYHTALESLLQTYDEIAKNDPERVKDLSLCDEMAGHVVRADNVVLSLVNQLYSYYGGAHPGREWKCVNFDAHSGQQLVLGDVVTDMNAFIEKADTKLKEQYWEEYPSFFTTVADTFSAIDTADALVGWSLGYEGITLYFSPYCLGSWAMGEQVIYLSFDEIADMILPYYTIEKTSYAVPFIEDHPLYVDATGSGSRQEVCITAKPADTESGMQQFTVTDGIRSCAVNDDCYGQESYLIRDGDRYYVWMFETSDNDYVILASIDLTTMGTDPEKRENLFFPVLDSDWQKTGTGYESRGQKECFTDPLSTDLGTRIDLLSSMTGIRNYHIGKDGQAETDEQMYRLQTGCALRTKCTVKAQLVDEEGNILTETDIPAGTLLRFVRGDGQTFADLQETGPESVELEENEWGTSIRMKEAAGQELSGPVYRVRVDKSSWPYLVNSMDEAQCFDGIMYAG